MSKSKFFGLATALLAACGHAAPTPSSALDARDESQSLWSCGVYQRHDEMILGFDPVYSVDFAGQRVCALLSVYARDCDHTNLERFSYVLPMTAAHALESRPGGPSYRVVGEQGEHRIEVVFHNSQATIPADATRPTASTVWRADVVVDGQRSVAHAPDAGEALGEGQGFCRKVR